MSDVIQTLPAFLAEPIDAISTQIVVKNLKDSRGRPITAMIGNILYATIEPTSQNNQEIISFTGIVDLGNNLVRLTGVTRNLNPIPPHTALTADVPHGTGATIIVTDTPQFWNERAAKDKNESITGLWEYLVATRPRLAADVDASDNRQFVTKGELLRAAFGTPTVPGVIVGGTAGQNITALQVVWLDEADGTWKIADGATPSEVNGTKKLGIALSTTTSGNPITSGVQLNGSISGFTGLSVGLVYVNDAGNVSNTPGTNVRPIGVAISSSVIIFDQAQATILSKLEKDALQGTSGTPSNTNRYVTNDDTAEAATESKVARRRSTGDITVPTTPTNSTDAASKAYVDGFTGTATENITANDAVSLNFYRVNQTTFQSSATAIGSVSTSGGTQTFALNCGTAPTKALVVFVSFGGASGLISDASVTYAGISMTLRTSTASSTSRRLMTFTLLNPTNGSNNVVVTIPANSLSSGDIATAAVCYNNVTSFSSPVTANATTISITPSVGDVIISAGDFGAFSDSNSVNNNTNVQRTGTAGFSSICRGDSGLSAVSTASSVTFTGGNMIAAILANNSGPIVYGVSRSSASNPANGVNINLFTNFVGFASSTVTQGNQVGVFTRALVPGFSSLAPLATYFLANSPGQIATTAGTNTKRVGIATNTTTILLKDSI